MNSLQVDRCEPWRDQACRLGLGSWISEVTPLHRPLKSRPLHRTPSLSSYSTAS